MWWFDMVIGEWLLFYIPYCVFLRLLFSQSKYLIYNSMRSTGTGTARFVHLPASPTADCDGVGRRSRNFILKLDKREGWRVPHNTLTTVTANPTSPGPEIKNSVIGS